MHEWTPPCHSHLLCIVVSAWRCFFTLGLPAPCHYIYPCSLLSANTFTFLVLLSNKIGGVSGGLLPLLKQTSMNSSRWGVTPPPPSSPHQSTHPPTAWPLPHSAGQQCCGLSLLSCTHSSHPHFKVHSQESASHRRLHISVVSIPDSLRTLPSLHKRGGKHFYNHKSSNEVTG